MGKKVICDKIRKWKGRYISIMVLENQSYVDYGMVFRVMESEAIGYGKQRKDRFREKYKQQRLRFDKNEYLSQMKRNERLDKESTKAILGILGVKADLESIKIIDDAGEEKYNMCKAIEDMKREERRVGKREGKQEGELSMALRSVKKLMKNQKVTCEEAMNMMGIPSSMYGKIQEMV